MGRRVKMTWAVFHRDSEYAKSVGDPILCEVDAVTRDEAAELANQKLGNTPTGVWPVPKGWAGLRRAKINEASNESNSSI